MGGGRTWKPPPSRKPPAPSPCEARAGRGPGRGAPSIELARLIGSPSPLPSPHSSVVGRGNRPAAWWWRQSALHWSLALRGNGGLGLAGDWVPREEDQP